MPERDLKEEAARQASESYRVPAGWRELIESVELKRQFGKAKESEQENSQ